MKRHALTGSMSNANENLVNDQIEPDNQRPAAPTAQLPPGARFGLAANAIHHRREMMTRLKTIIGHTHHPDFMQHDEVALRDRLRRFEEGFRTLEAANAMAKDGTADPNEREQLSNEFFEFEERYLDAASAFRRRIKAVAPAPPAEAPAQAAAAAPLAPQEVSLAFQPNIVPNWGKFDGNILNWRDFRNRFKLGTDHVPIPKYTSYKLSLLRDSMVGAAADAMRGWNLNNDNYDQAWNALVAKYGRKFPLASAFLTKFFALPKLERRANAKDLTDMVNATNELFREMEDLEYATLNWDIIIVQSLHARLDTETASKWENERKGDDHPTIAQMTTFLENQATLIVNKGLAHPAQSLSISTDRNRRTVTAPNPAPHRSDADTKTFPCAACGSLSHKPETCKDFGLLVYFEDRDSVARERKMCVSCLKRGHYRDACFNKIYCGEPACQGTSANVHHPLLCPSKGPRRPAGAHALAARHATPPLSSDDLRQRLGPGRDRDSNKRPSSSSS